MPDHAYWRRTLTKFNGEVTLFVHRSDGYVSRVRGRLVSLDDPVGPVLDVKLEPSLASEGIDGERTRVRGWDRLVAAMDAA